MLCLIWGTTWSVIQIGLTGVPPFSGVALRFALAGLLLLALAKVRGIRLGARPHEIRLWCINTVFAFCISYGVVYWGEQWLPSGLTAVLFATYPLFVGLLGHALLPAERMRRLEGFGVVIGFTGVAVIFSSDFGALGGKWVAFVAAVVLLSPASAALSSIAVKRYGQGVPAISLAAVPMVSTGLAMGAVALATERSRTFEWTPAALGALAYLAVVGSAVTFTLYFWLLAHLPAKRLALVAYITPVVALLIGTLRGETLALRALTGSLLVIAGVALSTQRR